MREQIAGMNCHYRFYPFDEFLRSMRALGVGKAELWSCAAHFRIDHTGYQDPAALRRRAAEDGVEFVCLTPEQSNPKPYNLAGRDPQLRQITRRYYRNAFHAAQGLGCRRVLINAGWHFWSEPYEAGWDRMLDLLGELAREATAQGVLLCVEPVSTPGPQLVKDLRACRRLLDEIGEPCLRVLPDTTNLELGGDCLADYLDAFGARADHIHFVDGLPDGHLAWGDGARDLPDLLDLLERRGYAGALSLELVDSRYFRRPAEADRRSVETLDRALAERRAPRGGEGE